MAQRLLTAIFFVCLFLPICAKANEPAAGHHATPSIFVERTTVAPDSTIRLLVSFKIDPTWHLYWDGQNDTGQPPRFSWTLPAGWTISEPQFPVPRRNVQPGGIVDYIYESSLTLGFTLNIPKAAETKSTAFAAAIEWLECSDRCMFGAGEVKAELNVQVSVDKPASQADSNSKKLLAAFDSHLPKPISDAKDLVIEVKNNTVVFSAKTAVRLEYYPGKSSSIPKEPLEGTSAIDGPLTVAFISENSEPIVDGIVAIYRTKGGPAEYYQVSRVPAPKATEPQKSTIK